MTVEPGLFILFDDPPGHGQACDRDQQRVFRGEDAVGEGIGRVVGQHRHGRLRDHRAGVELGADEMDAGPMAGGQLFGFLGVLLALPVAAVANVLLRYAHERYTHSRLYAGERPGIELDDYVDAGIERPAPDDLHGQ